MYSTKENVLGLEGPIIITGASGFIGANLFNTIFLVRKDVYAIVHGTKGWRLEGVSNANIISVDLTDRNATKNLIDKIKPKTVFDCKAYGAYSFEKDGGRIYKTNFLATVNLIEELALTRIRAYVHAGSSSEYGENCQGPPEDAKCEPNSDYAVSKLAVANYLEFIGPKRFFPGINLRLYSVYGPLEDPSRLVPTAIYEALRGQLPPFVDPDTSRDFVFVGDVCNAFILAALNIKPEIYGESFNIGTGVETTINDFAICVKELFKVGVSPKFGEMQARDWDLQRWYADPARARKVLGWHSATLLPEGLLKTGDWLKSVSSDFMKSSTKKNEQLKKRTISAIIACYKDAEAIPVMHKRLTDTFNELGIDYEIIFVNDCSPDDSEQVISRISGADPHVIGINHSRNFGSQMAFRSGMEIAVMEGVVLLDGDLQDPPEVIKGFYEKWEDGWDVVYGTRIKREMPMVWGIFYKAFYRIFSAFSYIKIPHDAGDFSLIDKKVVEWILLCEERDLFLRGLRAYVGFKQTGVNYIRPERLFGKSTNNLIKNIGWAKKGIFSFSDTPLNILTATGVVLLMMSIAIAAVVIILRVLIPDIAPRGITSVLIAILFFGSLNLFGVGLLGEYISKIIVEVKGRPRLIRSSIVRNGKQTRLLPDGKY